MSHSLLRGKTALGHIHLNKHFLFFFFWLMRTATARTPIPGVANHKRKNPENLWTRHPNATAVTQQNNIHCQEIVGTVRDPLLEGVWRKSH